MKRYICLVVFLICVSVANAQSGSPEPRKPQSPRNRVLVAAHRGDWRDEPENSVRGFLAAADLGVDIVELELKDNRYIREKGAKVWINSLWPSLNAGHDDDRAVEEHDVAGSWDWLIAHGAEILQTDRPKELIKYLHSR